MPKGLRARENSDRIGRRLQRRVCAAIDKSVRAGAAAYDRRRDLTRLIRVDPCGRGGETVEDLEAIVARLERALRAERNRARSGHWTYDLNRHIALRQAHAAERERLAALKLGRR